MKKEQQEMSEFIAATFGGNAQPKKKKQKRRVNTELRLKTKIPEADIVKRNLELMVQYK
jgi:hypothetical protein